MKVKMIMIMMCTLASILGSLYFVNTYNTWLVPYMCGFICPIICSIIYGFQPLKTVNKETKSKR